MTKTSKKTVEARLLQFNISAARYEVEKQQLLELHYIEEQCQTLILRKASSNIN